MELTWTKLDNRPYEVIVKNDKGKTIRKFFTLNIDKLASLETDELEQQVEDGLI